ncbi:MAG: hypothetical protein R3E08_12690 [Thiotrichaceae bacterium]
MLSIDQHCQHIYRSRSIRNKIVVLCEGDIHIVEGRESPQSYRHLQKYPDANFYKGCIPQWWQQKRPEFFNCGGRTRVLETYFHLVELHKNQLNDSYLDTTKLFAIVDADLQPAFCTEMYPFANTEEIFHHLYQQTRVNQQNASQHKIWVTGFVHKEAYFLAPELQQLFDTYPIKLQFADAPLDLQKIYIQMATDITQDNDLIKHFTKIKSRIDYFSALPCDDLVKWQQNWIQMFRSIDNAKQIELIYILLTIRKAKEYWKKLTPFGEKDTSERLQEQLMLKIADFYASAENSCQFHIPCFLKSIYDVVY